jgi:HEAT repeat protein
MADPLIHKIRALLSSEAPERQIAAAIVLGEIGARDGAVTDALAAAVAGGTPPVQRHALAALARLATGKASRKALPAVLACFGSRDEPLRRVAVDAAIAFGDDAIAPVRARLADATDLTERRALEEVLGRVGGKDASLDIPPALAPRLRKIALAPSLNGRCWRSSV